MKLLAQQADLHDIAPPISYSLIPTWAIFAGSVVVLLILGLLIWQLRKYLARRTPVPPTPRERALAALAQAEQDVSTTPPYGFSIRISDILRRYILEQFDLPMTRQTSLEFLNAIKERSAFNEEEKALLERFLERCDLIKFARYEATSGDSADLLQEAQRFVKGGALVRA